MKTTHRVVPALACAALLAGSSIASGQTQTLRYRFAKGDSATYQVTARVETTLGGLPMGSIKLDQTTGESLEVSVEDVAADGTATLRQTFKTAKIEMTTPMGPVAYDSAAPKPPSDPIGGMLAAMFGGMVGESVTLVISPTGSVQKVEGMAKILEKIFASMPPDPTGGMLTGALKGLLTDESIRSMFEQGFGHLPDQPVKPGDSWPGELKLGTEATGKLIGSLTTTLKALDGAPGASVARLGVTLVLKQDGAAPPGPMGATMKLEDGKGEGEILFDVDKGRMKSSTMRNEIHSAISMTGPDGSPMSATSVVISTTTVNVSVK